MNLTVKDDSTYPSSGESSWDKMWNLNAMWIARGNYDYQNKFTFTEPDGIGILETGTLAFDTTNDEITRSSGNWSTDGVTAGMKINISGSVSNDGTYTISSIQSGTVIRVQENLTTESAVAALANLFTIREFQCKIVSISTNVDFGKNTKFLDLALQISIDNITTPVP